MKGMNESPRLQGMCYEDTAIFRYSIHTQVVYFLP